MGLRSSQAQAARLGSLGARPGGEVHLGSVGHPGSVVRLGSVARLGTSAVEDSSGRCCSSPEAAGVVVVGRIAGVPAARTAGCQGTVVVPAAVAEDIGGMEPAARRIPTAAVAGLDGTRILGRHRGWDAAEAGDIGPDNHHPAAGARVATSASRTCPMSSTTLCGCGHLAETAAGTRTRSWSASGRVEERRQRCWRRRHPAAGSSLLHTGPAAAAVVAAGVGTVTAAASEAASGRAGTRSRPWLLSRRLCQQRDGRRQPTIAKATHGPDVGREGARGGIAIKSGEGMNVPYPRLGGARISVRTGRRLPSVLRWPAVVVVSWVPGQLSREKNGPRRRPQRAGPLSAVVVVAVEVGREGLKDTGV